MKKRDTREYNVEYKLLRFHFINSVKEKVSLVSLYVIYDNISP